MFSAFLVASLVQAVTPGPGVFYIVARSQDQGRQAGLPWLTILKKRGDKFVGSTIVYAHMQATGMVNDHIVDCFRHRELGGSPT